MAMYFIFAPVLNQQNAIIVADGMQLARVDPFHFHRGILKLSQVFLLPI
jgi:hypothetical protein